MATKLDLADAQLIGFAHGKWYGTDVIGLITAMVLTKKEWIKLKKEYPQSLDEIDEKEIDEQFIL